jgi:hypothetical protein
MRIARGVSSRVTRPLAMRGAMRGAMVGALIGASLGVAAPSHAQPPKAKAAAAVGCGVVTIAPWYRQQQSFSDSAGATFTDNALRQRLLAATGFDPNKTFSPELGYRIIGAADTRTVNDTTVLATLREMASKRQWPTRATVGTAGVQAAWLLSQTDSALSAAAMHRMMEAGIGESSPAAVAVMEDANRVRIGRGQLYGTHFVRGAAGKLTLYKLEDPAHVDMRREGAWLPTLRVSECEARKANR